MTGIRRRLPRALVWGTLLLGALSGGCLPNRYLAPPQPVPHELAKVPLPPYVIESPDVLLINAIRVIPKPPYRIEPLDTLAIRVVEALPDQPIQGIYGVESDGTVNLGFNYGTVYIRGMTVEEAKNAVDKALRQSLKPPYQVSVVIAESRALQQIRGPHLVQTDGTVNLGLYGGVFVDNLTVPQAKAAIEAHLSQFLVDPEISLQVTGFNSKVFYVITHGAGATQEPIARLPVTGKLCVLDALSQVNGLPAIASKKKIWIARPAPGGSCQEMLLRVNYDAIVKLGDTRTNYQILPGDRLVVDASNWVKADVGISRVIAPFERVIGTMLLGTSVIGSIQGVQQGQGFGVGGGGF